MRFVRFPFFIHALTPLWLTCAAAQYALKNGISLLAGLESFHIGGRVPSNSDLWRHTSLRRLSIRDFFHNVGGVLPMPDRVEQVQLPRLQQVSLDAVYGDVPWLPPVFYTLTGIRSLAVNGDFYDGWSECAAQLHQASCWVGAAWYARCNSAAARCCLPLHTNRQGLLRTATAFLTLLAFHPPSLPLQLPQLHSQALLELDYSNECDGDALVHAFAHVSTLRALDLRNLELTSLPPGPYLANLRTLLLPGDMLTAGAPEALAEARHLEVSMPRALCDLGRAGFV